MNIRTVKTLLCSVALTVLIFTSGCNKNNRRRGPQDKADNVKVSEQIKAIPLAYIIPPHKNVTGKKMSELPKKLQDDYLYGTLAGEYGNYRLCEETLQKVYRQEPKSTDTIHNLGLVYFKQGKIDDAIKAWRRTLELDPGYFEAYYNLAIFMLDLGRIDDGIALLNECIKHEPFHEKARLALGFIHKLRNQNKEAIIHFKAFEHKDRGNINVLMALGELYLLEGLYDLSLQKFEAASRIDKKNGKIFYQLGAAYHRRNYPDLALENYKKASELMPNSPEPYLNIGDIYESQGEFASAMAAYDTALAIDPTNTYARRKSEKVKQSLLTN